MKKYYSINKRIIKRKHVQSELCRSKAKKALQPRQQRDEPASSDHFKSTTRTKKSAEIFHIFLAIAILCVYLYILINLKSTFPRLAEALFTSYIRTGKPGTASRSYWRCRLSRLSAFYSRDGSWCASHPGPGFWGNPSSPKAGGTCRGTC